MLDWHIIMGNINKRMYRKVRKALYYYVHTFFCSPSKEKRVKDKSIEDNNIIIQKVTCC